MTNLIAPLSSDQIEKLKIEAIHEHRAALAKAEAAYESWQTAEAAKADTAADLHEDYTRLMLAARAAVGACDLDRAARLYFTRAAKLSRI